MQVIYYVVILACVSLNCMGMQKPQIVEICIVCEGRQRNIRINNIAESVIQTQNRIGNRQQQRRESRAENSKETPNNQIGIVGNNQLTNIQPKSKQQVRVKAVKRVRPILQEDKTTYEQFVKKFKKVYDPKREPIYYKNLKEINQMNKDPNRKYDMGLNIFADMDPSEFFQQHSYPFRG